MEVLQLLFRSHTVKKDAMFSFITSSRSQSDFVNIDTAICYSKSVCLYRPADNSKMKIVFGLNIFFSTCTYLESVNLTQITAILFLC